MLGLGFHNNAYRCLEGEYDLFKCQIFEYGDQYDIMGQGNYMPWYRSALKWHPFHVV
jgi:hypothetical protein